MGSRLQPIGTQRNVTNNNTSSKFPFAFWHAKSVIRASSARSIGSLLLPIQNLHQFLAVFIDRQRKATKMSEGTNPLFYLLIYSMLTLCLLVTLSNSDATLNSGLIFDKVNLREIPVNGHQLSFTRKISLMPLYQSLDQLQFATAQFETACSQISKHLTLRKEELSMKKQVWQARYESVQNPESVFRKIDNVFLRLASAACKQEGGKLPEIRNPHDLADLIKYKDQLTTVYIIADIYIATPTDRLLYRSDDSEPQRTTFNLDGFNTQWDYRVEHDAGVLLTEAKSSLLRYLFTPEEKYSFAF